MGKPAEPPRLAELLLKQKGGVKLCMSRKLQ